MSLLDDTYCQPCDRFKIEKEWNKHLYCSRHTYNFYVVVH